MPLIEKLPNQRAIVPPCDGFCDVCQQWFAGEGVVIEGGLWEPDVVACSDDCKTDYEVAQEIRDGT